MPRPALVQAPSDRVLELVERELVAERGQDLAGERAFDAELDQLAVEQRLVEKRVGDHLGGRDEPRRLVHADATLCVDRPAPERDRRDVSLAGGAEAQHEPSRALGQARLVRVPDHRRVEQGRRFQRIFLSEIGADQHSPVLAQVLVRQEMTANLLEPVQEEMAGLLVPVVKLAHHALDEGVNLRLREGHESRDDPLDAVLVGQLERPDHDPGVAGLQDDARAPDIQPAAAPGRTGRENHPGRGGRGLCSRRRSVHFHGFCLLTSMSREG